MVVVNQPGGGGAVGYTEGAQATPDGYTLTTAVTPLTILPHQVKTAFTYKSFDPIINVVERSVHVPGPVGRPLEEPEGISGLCQEEPGHDHRGQLGAGGGVHLVALAFEKAAGVKFNHIPFSGGGPSVTALLGGHINAVSVSPPEGISQVQAGKLRIIALFCGEAIRACSPMSRRSRNRGSNFTMGMWRGLVAPKGTPPEVIKKLHDAFKKGMDDPVFKKNAKDMAVNL